MQQVSFTLPAKAGVVLGGPGRYFGSFSDLVEGAGGLLGFGPEMDDISMFRSALQCKTTKKYQGNLMLAFWINFEFSPWTLLIKLT